MTSGPSIGWRVSGCGFRRSVVQDQSMFSDQPSNHMPAITTHHLRVEMGWLNGPDSVSWQNVGLLTEPPL